MTNDYLDDENIKVFPGAERIPAKKQPKNAELLDKIDCMQRALCETRGQITDMRREMRRWLTHENRVTT